MDFAPRGEAKIDKWMDGWMDGWMDRWMEGFVSSSHFETSVRQ